MLGNGYLQSEVDPREENKGSKEMYVVRYAVSDISCRGCSDAWYTIMVLQSFTGQLGQ